MTKLHGYLTQFEMTRISAIVSIIPPYLNLDRTQGSSIVLRSTGYQMLKHICRERWDNNYLNLAFRAVLALYM
jgi:hypothetical protein